MAGTREPIRIEIEDAEVRRRLSDLAARVGGLDDAMREIGEVITASTKERFGSERDPDGRPWAPSSPVTLERKLGSKILTDGGYLGDTIRYQLLANGLSVAIGTDRIYGAMMQFGGTKAQWPHLWGDIPARRFLGISDDDKDRIMEILRDHIAAS